MREKEIMKEAEAGVQKGKILISGSALNVSQAQACNINE